MNLRRYFYSFNNTTIFSLAFLAVLFTASGVLAQSNPVVTENALTGTRNWQIPSSRAALSREIEGYASATSVNVGSPITFYASVQSAQTVKIEIYRMGYYPDGAGGGYGGRLITTIPNLTVTNQPLSNADAETGLIECNWNATAQWTPPTGTVSGFFLAKLVGRRYDSYIIFVVRDDSRTSDYLFQSAVTTYQAYNYFPGNLDVTCPNTDVICPDWRSGKSLYKDIGFGPNVPASAPSQYQDKQARMVSFNRPYMVDNYNIYYSAGQFFRWEYNMVRFMERRGLDVTYITNIDTHADATNFTAGKHKAFLTAGHDEYYSWQMRDNLEQARNRTTNPLHLGFFSSNDVYWQIRFANSSSTNTAPANAPYRTIICYKLHFNDGPGAYYGDPNRTNDFHIPAVMTDNHLITQQWRENDNPTYMGTCPGGGTACYKKDEDELVGAMTDDTFIGGTGNFTFASACPASTCWVRNGTTATGFTGLVGYEPVIVVNSYTGRTLTMIGDSIASYTDPDTQTTYTGPAHSVYYKLDTGGRVFTAGSNYWAWGLDTYPNGETNATVPGGWLNTMYNADAETMTMNILNCFKNGASSCGGN
jgi:N,N-dimethylformamidase beta subunit-like, C-terminal